MLRNNNNHFMALLSDVDVATSTLPAVGTVVTDANLTKGAIVLTDVGLRRMSNTEYAALANGETFFVVQGKGAGKQLMKSPALTKGQVALSISKFRPAVQQVTTIGYNGTTGSLPTANNSDFWIKIRKNDNDAANRSQPMSLFAGPVKTDASGTQAELAQLLMKSGIRNFKDEPANGYLRFEIINDEAGTAVAIDAGVDATHYSFVKGSKVVTGTNSSGVPMLGSDETNDATLVVGDFLRAGTATTAPVYKITAITSGTGTTPAGTPMTLTLDIPFQGESTLIAIGSTEVITAAAGAAAEWGIVLTGVPAPFNVNSFRDYYTNRFTATFSDSSALVTHTTGARNGNGVWQQVAMDEYMSYGTEGQNEMLAVPPMMRDQEVKIPGVGSNTALTSKYSALAINWTESISGLVTTAGAKGTVLVYLNLADSSGSGILATSTDNTGETFVVALGLTASAFNE
jgi:hypothetical protein